MIYLLFIILAVMLVILFKINKYDITSPSIVFVFGFVFQAAWAMAYAQKWELGLHLNTFLMLVCLQVLLLLQFLQVIFLLLNIFLFLEKCM